MRLLRTPKPRNRQFRGSATRRRARLAEAARLDEMALGLIVLQVGFIGWLEIFVLYPAWAICAAKASRRPIDPPSRLCLDEVRLKRLPPTSPAWSSG